MLIRLLLIALVLAAAPRPAAASDVRVELNRLFSAAADRTPTGGPAAAEAYASLRKLRPNDSRIDYACALALLSQHRFDAAVTYLDRYLANQPDDLVALELRISALVQARQTDDALAGCVDLASRFPQAHSADAAWQQAAHFLGATFGYLELVPPRRGKNNSITEPKNAVLRSIANGYLESFDAGRQQVAERLAEFQAQLQARQDRKLAERDDRQQFVESALTENRTDLVATNEQLQSNAETVQDAQRQLTVLGAQLSSLARDRSLLSAQIVATNARFMQLHQTLSRRLEESPNGRAGISPVEAAQLNSLGLALAALNKQAFDLDRKMLTLRNQAGQLAGHGQQASQTVAASQQAIAEAESRAESLEKQALRLEKETARPPRLTPRMRAFESYEPMPLETEQARVLAWFN